MITLGRLITELAKLRDKLHNHVDTVNPGFNRMETLLVPQHGDSVMGVCWDMLTFYVVTSFLPWAREALCAAILIDIFTASLQCRHLTLGQHCLSAFYHF